MNRILVLILFAAMAAAIGQTAAAQDKTGADDTFNRIKKDTPNQPLGLMDTKGVIAATKPLDVKPRPLMDPLERKVLKFKYSDGIPSCPKGYTDRMVPPGDPLNKKLGLKSGEGVRLCYRCPDDTIFIEGKSKCLARCPEGYDWGYSDDCWKCPPGFEFGVFKGEATCVKTK